MDGYLPKAVGRLIIFCQRHRVAGFLQDFRLQGDKGDMCVLFKHTYHISYEIFVFSENTLWIVLYSPDSTYEFFTF